MNRSFSAQRAGLLLRWACFALLAAAFCAGCKREEITVYRVPKEAPTALADAGNGAGGELPFNYKMPAGWQQQTPSGMSLASFAIDGRKAELSVMTFPGEGASQLNLVNIVRENMGLAPLSNDDLNKIVQPVQVGGENGSLIDLTRGTSSPTNNAADSITVAVVPHGGATWFFKLAGVSDVVAAQRPALLEFLKSVSFNANASVPASPHGQDFTSVNAPVAPEPAPAVDGSEATPGKPNWQVPSDWKEVSPGAMLLAKFLITHSDGEADVTVSSFAGPVGGTLANVNRWRGQVGLKQISEGDLDKNVSSLDVPDGKAMLVDLSGKSPRTGKETRLVGIIWPREGQTWFYKLMGDAPVAAQEKDAFLKFVQSVRYSNG